jgi:hypothetical protein
VTREFLRGIVAALLATSLLLATEARAGGDEGIWLDLEAPAEAGSGVPVGLVEVRGRAGVHGVHGYDVVIVIDLSDSTLESSGLDIDGDGPEAATDPALLSWLAEQGPGGARLSERLRKLDFDDTVLMAELTAAQALLERLDLRNSRVGLVAFSDEAWVLAPLGSPRDELLDALENVRRGFYRHLRGTNFADAVQTAHAALGPAGTAPEELRDRSILFLSDGAPTLPVPPERARRRAVEASFAAAADGIRIYAFALGRKAFAALDVYRAMAGLSGGRLEKLSRPAHAISRLRRVDLAGVEGVRIDNLTTGGTARALRIFPDGSFDGFVELAPGENRLRIAARALDGAEASLERQVTFERNRSESKAVEEERMQALLEELRRRTRETELWAELERGRQSQRGELDLEAEKRIESDPD